MLPRSPPQNARAVDSPAAPQQSIPVVPGTPTGPAPVHEPLGTPADAPSQPDLATLLTNGLANIQQSMGGMETRLAGKIDSLEGTVRVNERRIEVLTSSLESNTRDLADLRARMDRTDSQLEMRIDEMVRSAVASSSTSSGISLDHSTMNCGRSSDQVSRYWKARRSLRLWPIAGPSLRDSVTDFLVSKLEFDRLFVESLGDPRIERVVDPG